jgi:pimeloyl-ACP methyl ester carboxylesterase
MRSRWLVILVGALLTTMVAVWVGQRFTADLAAARLRVATGSKVIATRAGGALEYTEVGQGPALLMLHGTGGGFDQALRFTRALSVRGFRIIAPSRFGYLRSDFPADASIRNQADALVELLEHLGIDRAVVAGGSAGALPAAQFALDHPSRCAALVLLVPAANVRGNDPVQFGPLQRRVVQAALRSDFVFWVGMTFAPRVMIGTLLATDPSLLVRVSAEERERAFDVLHDLLPVSLRARGFANDWALAGNPARMPFGQVAVPTMVISAEDDRFGTAQTARELAGAIAGAQLLMLPDGGHLWLGHDQAVADAIAVFARAASR